MNLYTLSEQLQQKTPANSQRMITYCDPRITFKSNACLLSGSSGSQQRLFLMRIQ